MRRHTVLLTAACLAATSAGSALAADPGSGTISSASPKVSWTGSLTMPYISYLQFLTAEGAADQPCDQPTCDRFELDVAGPAADVTFFSKATTTDGGFDTLRIVKPDGTVLYVYDDTGEGVKTKIKSAKAGKYMVDVTSGSKTSGSYEAYAEMAGSPVVALAAPVPVGPAPAAKQDVLLTVKAPAASARKLARSRRLSVPVQVSREVSNVSAVLKKGTRTIARATLGRVTSSGTLVFKLPRRVKAGAYALTVRASAADSVSAVKTVKLRVKR